MTLEILGCAMSVMISVIIKKKKVKKSRPPSELNYILETSVALYTDSNYKMIL